jgi:porphobilinogen synthase
MFPFSRLRRTRKFPWLRDLVAETNLLTSDLVLPIFIKEGIGLREEIKTMPGVYVLSIDEMEKEAKKAQEVGIQAIALFPQIEEELKSQDGEEAYNQENLICRAIRSIKNANIDIGIICDVALDPYTSHGHDGILEDDVIDNDATIEALQHQALALAKAGADILAPSDMMDGRIGAIRSTLEEFEFYDIPIISYSAKYASSLYSPFRDALGSTSSLGKSDKKTYQMDYRNAREAIREVELDIAEGADIILIKPALVYQDVIKEVSQKFNIPIFAYHVSGEYAMLKFAALAGAIDYDSALIETLTSLKRCGAKAIFTYAAIDAAKILTKNKHLK